MYSYKYATLLLIGKILANDPDLIQKLKLSSFNILTATTADEIMHALNSGNPDIIVMDTITKDSGNEDIDRVLKKNGPYSSIPIIMLTSKELPDFRTLSSKYNIVDFIIKPFSNKEILARILNLLRVSELEQKNNELLNKLTLLEQLAITDELTGLYNRRYIMDRLHSEISHSARYNEPLTFIILDIDFFKRINDTFGHVAGDKFLKEVSNQIKNSIREGDIPVRYGGEEFLVVCPNTNTIGGKTVAERIRANVENSRITINNKEIFSTVSLGLSSRLFSTAVNTEAEAIRLINEADTALYRAKSTGRNCIKAYNEIAGRPHFIDRTNGSGIMRQGTELSDDHNH